MAIIDFTKKGRMSSDAPVEAATGPAGADNAVQAIGEEQLKQFNETLMRYKNGKQHFDERVIEAEKWWKLRMTHEQEGATMQTSSGWLHNVIVSKHADAINAYPSPNILPREASDKKEAEMLSSVVPCILEANDFEDTYDLNSWRKLKFGTGNYKVVWDPSKLNGLGDISIVPVSMLNVFWEPGLEDIQKSPMFFQTELIDKKEAARLYPELHGEVKGDTFTAKHFAYDDAVSTADKCTVVEAYYKKGGKLHYCKYIGTQLIYASENDTERPVRLEAAGVDADGMPLMRQIEEQSVAERGWYDHGRYPYELDALFPIEGSPGGYGYVDLCKNAQEQIDALGAAIMDNALDGATPRYFFRDDGAINEAEFADHRKKLVHVNGNLGEDSIRVIDAPGLNGNYIALLNTKVQELREISGNTETSTGSTSGGVTAASAIAALQEASGKGSKASTKASYRVYARIVWLVIELIRQFYDAPRTFRITGQYGTEQFVSYSNQGLQLQHQGVAFGQDMGYRKPVFDIKVVPQKEDSYTRLSRNELALQFYQLGFFSPQMTDPALATLEMMDFDGKEELMNRISRNGTMAQMLAWYQQIALGLAQRYNDAEAEQLIAQNIMQMSGMSATPTAAEDVDIEDGQPKEHALVEKARANSQQASQPDSGPVIAERKDK